MNNLLYDAGLVIFHGLGHPVLSKAEKTITYLVFKVKGMEDIS